VLERMTPEERISASRHGGELERIACNMADLDPDY
jgi:hypothetical protein